MAARPPDLPSERGKQKGVSLGSRGFKCRSCAQTASLDDIRLEHLGGRTRVADICCAQCGERWSVIVELHEQKADDLVPLPLVPKRP